MDVIVWDIIVFASKVNQLEQKSNWSANKEPWAIIFLVTACEYVEVHEKLSACFHRGTILDFLVVDNWRLEGSSCLAATGLKLALWGINKEPFFNDVALYE